MASDRYTDKYVAPKSKLDCGLDVFTQNLEQQTINQQKQFELLQAEQHKIQLATEKEKILLQMAKDEAAKQEKLAEIEIKQKEESLQQMKLLNAIEADKRKQLAQLEIEAKRRNLNL